MQRYGPPLSYPHLRIPGLNAPIPAGARYGFGSSEWGKPPVDSKGNPLYGGMYVRESGAEQKVVEFFSVLRARAVTSMYVETCCSKKTRPPEVRGCLLMASRHW